MLIPRLHQAITLLDNGRSDLGQLHRREPVVAGQRRSPWFPVLYAPAEDGRNFVNEPEAGK
jgi:hypothetical protein